MSEPPHNFIAIGQIRHVVAAVGMRLDREDLAVDTKAADSVFGTELQCQAQCLGICQTELRQFRECGRTIHAADASDRRVAKCDRLSLERAAKPEA